MTVLHLGLKTTPLSAIVFSTPSPLAKPDVLVVGLGAPKQECWVYEHRDRIEAAVSLCVGATIDFLAGEQTRAPRWMQNTGTEWLYRIYSDPGRLAKRYAKDAVIFPQLVFRQWRASKKLPIG